MRRLRPARGFAPGRCLPRIASAALWLALAAGQAAAQQPSGDTAARGTLRFPGYPDAPPFQVVPRRDDLFFYPCKQCHEFMDPNDQVRDLAAPHDIELVHGDGRMWCLQCHSMVDRDMLWTLLREPVDFDEAYVVCGGCHANRQKDWYYGAHGKRVSGWRGERLLYNCTQCHDPHSPSIKPRKALAPPPVRARLLRQHGETHEVRQIWERRAVNGEGENPGEH